MKKSIKYLILALLAALAAIGYLFAGFVDGMKANRGSAGTADAIVVLTGGKGRTNEGLALLRRGKGRLLILSGVHEDADLDAIFLNRVNEIERRSIILEKASRSTYENAVEVRKLINERGLKSMVLLTSGYHIMRAELIFRRIMPSYVRIEAYGVSTPNLDEERWWDGRGLAILSIEFLKYYWYAGRFALEGEPG